MEGTGRKNAAGSWLRWEMLRRIVSVSMLAMAAFGFGIGFMFRGLPVLDALDGTIATWGIVAMMSLVCGALYVFGGRIESTWRAGWDAERRIGDLIEHAIVEAGWAFAHDVKEAFGGSGNVDHVATTPAGVWVVETKAHWLSPRRFPAVLGQAANNARRVCRHAPHDRQDPIHSGTSNEQAREVQMAARCHLDRATVRIGENPSRGRDFVAGDVHGELPALEILLGDVGFTPERDRLFALGDLVDRGPRSADALAWTESGRIALSVRGNHEQMLIERIEAAESDPDTRPWTMHPWFPRDVERENWTRWTAMIRNMPIAATIRTRAGSERECVVRSVPPHVRARARTLSSIRFRYAYGGTDQNPVIHLYTDDQAHSRGDACVALGVGRAGQP